MGKGSLPLEGLRVADFGWVWAGTLLGHVLADYGAEVIKIESRARLDGLRLGTVFELGEELDKNPWFHNLNRNKLSMTVDFTKPRGADLIRQLVKKSDVVIENFTPGVLAHHGLDYPSLAGIKPDLVMVSLSATGQQGPLSHILAYAPILSALSGIASLIGYQNDRPLGFQHAYADPTASLFGLLAVLAALRYRNRTGKGQYIDLSQYESVVGLVGEAIMDYNMNGRVAGPQGNRNKTMAPHGIYPCKGEDKWVSIAVKTESEWRDFCEAIGNPPWTKSDKFHDASSRISNASELDGLVSQFTLLHSNYEVAQLLQKSGVAATPVLSTEGIFFDPHYNERQTFISVEHPVVGSSVIYNVPWKLSNISPRPARHSPRLGEDNNYVFGELLGLSAEEIQRLDDEKVIH